MPSTSRSRSSRPLPRSATCLLVLAILLTIGCQPDVTGDDGIQFGSHHTPWDGELALSPSDAAVVSGGLCTFDIEYDMANVGNRPAEPAFWNRLRSGADVISQQSGLTLAAAETRTIRTQGNLAPGSHSMSLTLDDENNVAESDEANNGFGFTVVLTGPCGDLPDVTALGEVTFGDKTAPWGGTLTLDDSDAINIAPGTGRCVFRMSYDIRNPGPVATSPPFWNRTRAGSEVITQQSNLELAAGEERNILTDPYISAGTHTVELSLDDDAEVTESDETNNRFSLTVTVGGSCT